MVCVYELETPVLDAPATTEELRGGDDRGAQGDAAGGGCRTVGVLQRCRVSRQIRLRGREAEAEGGEGAAVRRGEVRHGTVAVGVGEDGADLAQFRQTHIPLQAGGCQW